MIGVGALSLPLSFSEAGIILGTILLVVLAFMSYMTATFMVEAMAAANAYVRHKARQNHGVVEAQSKGIQSAVGKNDTDCVSLRCVGLQTCDTDCEYELYGASDM